MLIYMWRKQVNAVVLQKYSFLILFLWINVTNFTQKYFNLKVQKT